MTWPLRDRTYCRGCGATKPHPPIRCQLCSRVFAHVAALRNHLRWAHAYEIPPGRRFALLIDHARAQARSWSPLPLLPTELFPREDGERR